MNRRAFLSNIVSVTALALLPVMSSCVQYEVEPADEWMSVEDALRNDPNVELDIKIRLLNSDDGLNETGAFVDRIITSEVDWINNEKDDYFIVFYFDDIEIRKPVDTAMVPPGRHVVVRYEYRPL